MPEQPDTRRPVIELSQVTKSYGDATVLHGIDLDIREGEFISLLGPSGCGKTTTLRIIGGFTQPTGGEVKLDGKSMVGVPPNKRPVNTVFQSYALFPHLTVAENVAFGPRMHGIAKAERSDLVREALARVGLEDFAKRHPNALSGGQRQRVALARCLVNRPRVLLLDEPLAALDLKMRKRMQRELREIHSELGLTFVLVTHDQEEAMSMSDRIVVMNGGAIEQIGTGEDLYHSPRSVFTADFIGAVNLIPGTMVSVGPGERAVMKGPSGDLPGTLSPGVDLRAGDRATMILRPEALRVAPDAKHDPSACTIGGTIRDRINLGTHTVAVCESVGGHLVDVRVPAGAADQLPHSGAPVTLRWNPDDARILAG